MVKHWWWVLLGTAFAGLLVTPCRRDTLHHIRSALGLVWEINDSRIDSLISRSPESPLLHIAYAEWSANLPRALREYAKAAIRNPEDQAIYASAVACYIPHIPPWMLAEGFRRPRRPPRNPEPWQMETLQDAIYNGKHLEPGNAFYNYIEAAMALSRRETEKAYLLFKGGVGKPRYDPHRKDAFLARLALLELAGTPSLEAKNLIFRFPQPQVSRLLDMSRYIAHYGRSLEESSEHAQAIECYSLLVQMGFQITRSAWSASDLSHGLDTIQMPLSIRYRPDTLPVFPPPTHITLEDRARARRERTERQCIEYFKENGRPDLAARLARQVQDAEDLQRRLGDYQKNTRPFRKRLMILRSLRNAQVLALALSFGLLFILTILSMIRLLIPKAEHGLPWKGWHQAVLLIPVILMLILLSIPTVYQERFSWDRQLDLWDDVLRQQQLLTVFSILLLGGGAALRIYWHVRQGSLPPESVASVFGNALGGILPRLLAIMLTLYLLLWIPALPVRRQVEAHLDSVIQNEASLVLHPENLIF